MQIEVKPKVPLVTLAGARGLAKPETMVCMKSWARARFARKIQVMGDGTIGHDHGKFPHETGFGIIPPEENEELVRDALKNRPGLLGMRRRSVMFRKIIDIPLWFRKEPQIVFADTDIYFLEDLELPDEPVDLAMGVDDATSYSGNWRIATEQKALPGMNAGFLIYRPGLIDLDFLEYLAHRYFSNSQVFWLAEQPLWAILMSKWEKTWLFSGEDVRVIGGLQKRSRREILENRFVWLRRGRPALTEAEISPLIEGAAVAHMAGSGKKWIPLCEKLSSSSPHPRKLRVCPAPVSSRHSRILTAARIFTSERVAAFQKRKR